MFRLGLNYACAAYKQRLEQRPLQTKMMTSAALFSFGDFVCQKTEATLCRRETPDKQQNFQSGANSSLTQQWDASRTLRQGMIGGLLLSPVLHVFLTRVISRATFPSLSRATNIGLRVGIHQACMMPVIQFTLLFVSAAMQSAPTVEARLEAGKKRFSDKWRPGFTASLMYWPIINTFMYACVKPRFMNLYVDMASLVFASIMSYITYKDCSCDLSAIDTQIKLPMPVMSQSTWTDMPTTLVNEAATTLPKVWSTHLRSIMNARLVEAEAAEKHGSGDDTPWLLFAQT